MTLLQRGLLTVCALTFCTLLSLCSACAGSENSGISTNQTKATQAADTSQTKETETKSTNTSGSETKSDTGTTDQTASGQNLPTESDQIIDTKNQSVAESTASGKTGAGTRGNQLKVLTPTADGSLVYSNELAAIDVSHSDQGYMMVSYNGSNSKVKMQVFTPAGTKYQYTLHAGYGYETFPLSEGSGTYDVKIYENVSGSEYSLAASATFDVSIGNSFGPFLYPSQYVYFNSGSSAVAKGAELASSADSDLEVVENIYHYVISTISYDYNKLSNVTSGYVPDSDSTLATGTGICFDYAALMATMLRTQQIPTRLDVGNAGSAYHAWISVFIQDIGWIDNIIYFDGTNWILMDPTFAANATGDGSVESFIGDGSNYTIKYIY